MNYRQKLTLTLKMSFSSITPYKTLCSDLKTLPVRNHKLIFFAHYPIKTKNANVQTLQVKKKQFCTLYFLPGNYLELGT